MNQKTELPGTPETVVPISKTVVGSFAKVPFIGYAIHENGALYISNGQYIMKTNQEDLSELLEQVNRRRKADPISAVEKSELLTYVEGGRGKFELSQEPLDFETGSSFFISLYADDKQYFGYDKKYVDVFNNGENRLFVDDNASYDYMSHNMVVKTSSGEIVGVVLPIRLPDELYMEMADVLPLKGGCKTELERIKANPTNDPYIGKEFFDGLDNHIISAIRKVKDVDMYVVPTVQGGKPSRGADYIKTDEIDDQIARWEMQRIDREKENQEQGKECHTEKENPPMQEEPKQYRPFTLLRNSPWGEVTACDKLCPGVYMVSAVRQGGVMVTMDMTAALSPAALKCGAKYNDYLCFEDNGAKDVVLRELLDKKLWTAPGGDKDREAFIESINKSLRERQPQYWQSRENRRAPAPPAKTAPVHDER